MLVVLLIISVLLLLFVPNLTKQKDSVTDTGNRAVVKVVESQAELYELNHQNEKASLSSLSQKDKSLKNKQKLTVLTMWRMQVITVRLQIKAFTLLESLLTLGIVSLLCWLLAGSVHQAFGQVEETLFFSEFERVYQETQKMSIAKEERTLLSIDMVGFIVPIKNYRFQKGWKWSERSNWPLIQQEAIQAWPRFNSDRERGGDLSVGNWEWKN